MICVPYQPTLLQPENRNHYFDKTNHLRINTSQLIEKIYTMNQIMSR